MVIFRVGGGLESGRLKMKRRVKFMSNARREFFREHMLAEAAYTFARVFEFT